MRGSSGTVSVLPSREAGGLSRFAAMAEDSFDLARFLVAQEGVYATALAELRHGRKASHWMWFIFPQMKGLGRSEMAWRYGIGSIDEAAAYLTHPVLGPRLRECTEAVLEHDAGAAEIFGSIDAVKLGSSMTLFEKAARGTGPFGRCLDEFFGGERDRATLRMLGGW